MAAPESTMFQVNYKLPDGTLVNLYAKDVKELETGLTDLQMVSALIISTSDSFHGARPAAPVQSNQPAPVAAPAPAQTGAEGVSAKGPWKGYMCAAPKGTPQEQKCSTIWVR